MADRSDITSSVPAPTPLHLLRSHSSPISALACSNDNERIYSADTSGKIVVTSTRSLRVITAWNAHTDSVLGVEEWEEFIVTHGRDNKIHVWKRIEELSLSVRIGGSADLPNQPTPTLCYSLDVNALNFCRFSLLGISEGPSDLKALIALPNLVDSSTADIWVLPSTERIHAAIGQEVKKSIFSADPGGRNNSGIIMSLHLYGHTAPMSDVSPSEFESLSTQDRLRILMAYEDGSVVLREYTRKEQAVSIESEGWEVLWKSKLHVESIMAMRVSRANDFAVSVSADHIVGRYDLTSDKSLSDEHGTLFRTKHAGNASVAIRDDGRLCAVGGWDGKARLYSTKSFKPLGTLRYHGPVVQCVEFARDVANSAASNANEGTDDEGEDDDEMSAGEKTERSRWLMTGAKDNRVAIWSLISFGK